MILHPYLKSTIMEYQQCNDKMFKGGRKKCKKKVSEKTLKMLEAKLN